MTLAPKKSVFLLTLGFFVLFSGFLATFYLTFRDVTRVTIEKQPRSGLARQTIEASELPNNIATSNQEPPQSALEGVLPVARSSSNVPTTNEPAVSQGVRIANLRFLEEGYDGPVKGEAVYEKGAKLWLKFDIVGYKIIEGGLRLSEDYHVYKADDFTKAFASNPKVVHTAQAWDVSQPVTFRNAGKVPPPGDYVIEIVVHDYNAGSFTSLRTPLRIVRTKGKPWPT